MTQLLIFTDLDGTLLEHRTYSFKPAEPALKRIQEKKIPLIFSTSKTRLEIEYWQRKLDIYQPFISENGGGIFIPKDYFSTSFSYNRLYHNYKVIELGIPYNDLSNVLKEINQKFHIRSFKDMSPQELSDEAGLPLDQAALALQRDYDLPFKLLDETERNDILEFITQKNLSVMIGGRYLHLMGNHTKGDAVKQLLNLFSQQYRSIETIALGDSFNDLSMLDMVDKPYLVQQPNGTYISNKYNHIEGIGPNGWCNAILKELNNHL